MLTLPQTILLAPYIHNASIHLILSLLIGYMNPITYFNTLKYWPSLEITVACSANEDLLLSPYSSK